MIRTSRKGGRRAVDYLTRPWHISPIATPASVIVVGDWIEATFAADRPLRPAPAAALFDFCLLGDADAPAIADFAGRHGMLGSGMHRLFRLRADETYVGRRRREPIRAWRELAKQAYALLRVAAAINAGENPSRDDWLGAVRRSSLSAPTDSSLSERRALVDEWLTIGSVRPALSWAHQDPAAELSVTDGGLLGVIAAQMLLAVASGKGIAICSSAECGRPFPLDRVPIAGRRTFCPTCGVQAAWRESKRDERRADKAKGVTS